MPETADSREELRAALRYVNAAENSDKDYVVSLARSGDGWSVNILYGRHGGTMSAGCKTGKEPVPYERARKEYDKVLKGQLAKGYQPDGGAAGNAGIAIPKQHSGIGCQHLHPIDAAEASDLITDPAWIAQEKHDGERLLMRKAGNVLTGINKRGIVVPVPEAIGAALAALPHDFIVDGEKMRGGHMFAFDLLELDGVDLRPGPCTGRLSALTNLLDGVAAAVLLVETAHTAGEKRALHGRLTAAEREGIVFKRADAPYTAGKANKGGHQRKRKFYETCSVLVAAENDRRSVAMRMLDGEAWVDVGNVTVPPNCKVPAPGSVIEVRYLYAFLGGSIYQPTYLGERGDVDASECVVGQLKYKAA